jgi:hypothetical protein
MYLNCFFPNISQLMQLIDLLLYLQHGGLHFSRKQHAMVIHIGFQSCAHDYPHWFSFLCTTHDTEN